MAASSILYRLEDCFNETLRNEFLHKLSFEDVPVEVLQSILYSDDDVGDDDDDDYAALQDEEELVKLMTMVREKNEENSQWWTRKKIDELTVDQFMKYFVHSKLFRRTVKRVLDPVFSSMTMEVLQLADNGEELLGSVEESDVADNYDILKLRKVELVKVDRDVAGSTISAKYTASFEFETRDDRSNARRSRRYVSTFFNTGSLCLLFASLGELGNTDSKNNTTQNDIRLADASYEIGVNGDLVTWGSKLRFLKNELLSVIVDTKYLWKCMVEEADHPFYKECHPARNGGNLQAKSFLKRYAYRFSVRNSRAITEKQMVPKIRYSKTSGKSYMKFTMSVLRKVGAKEKRKTFDDKGHVTDFALRSRLQEELGALPQKTYRYFHINLHSLLGRTKLNHKRRGMLGYGDLIRFSVSTTCYSDSQKNVFTVLHSPRGNAEVLLSRMYLRNAESAEMSRPGVDSRLRQIALANLMKTEHDGEDFKELFATTETRRKELTSGEDDDGGDDDQGPIAKKMRRSINDQPFQNE